jgi:predicted nucleic acid-binding protein
MMNVTNANYYFDTSALLPYYRQEALTPKVQAFISSVTPPILINHLTLVEMASALSRWCRTSELTQEQASMIHELFYQHINLGLYRILPVSEQEFKRAEAWLLQRDTSLRSLDALHLATALHADACLITADKKLYESAVYLNLKSQFLV